ncbi:MAG TPA: NADH-quinone oxidoreductase subunit C [Acidimicrobiales bacterium]|nr:NADH-quinone oxidoreductase subunit C [Acidimicrobiales bacterium]
MSDAEATSGFEESPVADEVTAAAVTEPETRFGVPVTSSRSQQVLHPSRDELVDLVRTLRDDEGFRVCIDVTAVDYLAYDAPRHLPPGIELQRFEVVVGLLSHTTRERLRLRVQVPADDPRCPSLFDVHPGTEALEREVYDMYGIEFTGHPDLTRILMPEDWEGFPLRKDYPVGAIPVQFKGVQNAR